MENFEVGTACCWTGHKFVAGERGMKCRVCEKVMTVQAWDEKGKCFLGHTNAVSSSATNSFTPRTSRTPRTPRISSNGPHQQLRWRDCPSPISSGRPPQQLRWRDSPLPVNPTNRSPRTPVSVPQNLRRPKWQVILIAAISGFLLFVIISLLI